MVAAEAASIPPPVLFDVTTEPGSAIVIVGYFDPEDPDAVDGIVWGPAQGRAGETGKSNVVVNRPPPAIRMDFLADLSCFTEGDIYSLDCRGTLVIGQKKDGTAFATYYFKAHGKDPEGELTHYRIDADAEIVGLSDPPGSFPKNDDLGYTVTLTNIRLSVDTGSRKSGCEDSFPNASATIRLDRIETP